MQRKKNNFDTIFSQEVIENFQSHLNSIKDKNSEETILLDETLSVLKYEKLEFDPKNIFSEYHFNRCKARNKAWRNYINFSGENNFINADITSRLQFKGKRIDNVRGALNECLVFWFWGFLNKITPTPKPKGRNTDKGNTELEMQIESDVGIVKIEVKSPEIILNDTTYGTDFDKKINAVIKKANSQFNKKDKNILIIVPNLGISLYNNREILTRALFTDFSWSRAYDPKKGEAFGPIKIAQTNNGKLFKLFSDSPISPQPRHKCISKVIVIEEYFDEKLAEIKLEAIFIDNPYAYKDLSNLKLEQYPSFALDENIMQWSDGYEQY